jgi:hypothetical protein
LKYKKINGLGGDMRKFAALWAILLIAVTVFGKSARGFEVDYSRLADSEMRLDFQVAEFTVSTVEKDGVNYSVIKGAGSVFTVDEGYAEMPYHATAVQLKDDRNVEMKYNFDSYEDIELEYPLLPSRGIISRSQKIDEIPYKIAKESEKNEWYPGKIAEITDPFIMRDIRGTNIIVYPYQYNAATKTLRVYRNLRVELTEDYSEPVNPLTVRSKTIFPEMSGMYKTVFLNYNETKALPIGGQGEILVIYTPNNGGLAAIQPWIDWKRQKGFKVHTLEKANGTDLYVTQDIKNQYLANTNILYAQIVGDFPNLKSQVVNSVTSTTGAQDPMLGCTVGTDQYIDVVVGRFSVSSETELTNQINKAINYEKNPEISATWYEKGIGIASNEGAGSGDDGEGDQAHSDIIINYKQLPFTYASVSTAYQANNVTKSTILGFVNDGRSIINYTGHGNYDCFQSIYGGYLYDTDVATLTNGTKLPFVVSVACLVGNIEYTSKPCFAEAWMRKTNGGAVGGWFSSISQPWLPPMKGQDYYNDIIKGSYDYSTQPGDGINITEQRTTVGTVCCNASNLMLQESPTDAATKDTQEAWIIFGDVSLQLRTDPPKLITNTNETLLPGNYSTTITATSGGAAVPGAIVTLYQNGVNYSAISDSNGAVSIDHGFSAGEYVTLTVSGFNLETEQSEVMVTGNLGGTFSYSPTSLSYGNVQLGSSSVKTFQISNSHSSEYLVGDITTIEGYTVALATKEEKGDAKNVLSYSVAPSSSKTFNLSFSPLASVSYNGNITITSTDTNNATKYLAVSGTGYSTISAPTLVSPASGSNSSLPNPVFDWSDVSGATSYTILIDNNSDFSSPEYTANPTASTYQPTELAVGTYYWKVRTNVNSSFSEYSGAWTISITPFTLPFTQNFNASTSLPVAWQNKDNQGSGQVWQFGTHTSGLSGADGNYAYLNSDAYGSGNTQNADLITPTIDMSGYSSITLTFKHYFRSYSGTSATLSYSLNGGSSWTTVQSFTATTANPATFSQVMTAFAGQSNVKVKWNFTGSWGYYWDVDDISISGTLSSPPSTPTLATPANGSTTTDATPTFDWSDSSGATSYTIQVDNNSNFSSPEIQQSPSVSTYTHSTDLALGTYYWRVLATNANGSSSYTSAWTVTIEAAQYPNIALSTTQVSTTAAPEGTDTDSFNINNTGTADLSYTLSHEYVSKGSKADITVHSNDFATFPGTGYTNSNWAANAGAARVTGAATAVTGVLTSPAFDGTACTALYLDFTQNFSFRNGSWCKVEYYNGTEWTQIYYEAAASTTTAQHIALPVLASNMQIRFTGYMTRSGQNAYWEIDNIVVSGPEIVGPSYTWLTINSALTGTVAASGSNAINLTCDAAGLAEGTYNANITVATNDPDEPSKILPVQFVVVQNTVIPGVPSNLVTSVVGTDIQIDWSAAADATSYDVYSSDDPYGTFTFVTNVSTNQYVVPYADAKKFWYIVSKNATKDDPKKVETDSISK